MLQYLYSLTVIPSFAYSRWSSLQDEFPSFSLWFQLGVAVGFLVPPHIVPNSETLEEIGHDLSVMFYAGACVCTLLLLLMLLG